ncbi:hypothetical protein E9529_06780 [Blastococcus sp. KM273128]|uniref:hypothetical protein n=1 Tax=Blastococcus sp. KM273128 TaxID=2570314 RepID=UPI001F3A7949|nr:hypothetical protein [Blastococcus sp. KM273128]MCF6743982.1 hypothetical protein [Blastococcus sp. KM273128]
MTAATARVAEPGTATVLARAAGAEWVRLRTVRTTWWCLLAAAVATVGIGTLAALDEAEMAAAIGSTAAATVAGEYGTMVGQFALLLVVLLAVTSEYGSGAIAPTLQWTPRRGVLLAARVAVPIAVATAVGVLLALVADVLAKLLAPDLVLSSGELTGSLGGVAAVLVAGGVLTAGLGFLMRSTAAALATVFLLQLVLPALLPAFGELAADVGELLPGTGAVWVLIDALGITAGHATTLLVGWSAAALVAGGWALLRRDAG